MFFTLGSRGQTRDKLSIQHHNFITLPNMLSKEREKKYVQKIANLSPNSIYARRKKVFSSHILLYILKLGRGRENSGE